MEQLLSELKNLPKFQEYIQSIKQKNSPISVSGLSDVGKMQWIGASLKEIKENAVIVTYNELQAKRIKEDLSFFLPEVDIQYFPKREIVAYDYVAESKDLPFERIEVLQHMHQKKKWIVVTTIEAMMQDMIAPELLYQRHLQFVVGNTISQEEVKKALLEMGYERSDLIEGKGQFSVRGGIVDIAISDKKGIRVEFWGDEIDSIREFDILSQRSNQMLEKADIYAAHEFLLQDSIEEVIKRIEANTHWAIEENHTPKTLTEYRNAIQNNIQEDIEQIKTGDYISKIDKYFNQFYTKTATLLDYFPKNTIVFLDENTKLKQRKESIQIEYRNLAKSLWEKQKMIPQAILNMAENTKPILLEMENQNRQIIFLEKQDIGLASSSSTKYSVAYRDIHYYKSEMELLLQDMQTWIKEKRKVVVLSGGLEQTKKFANLLNEKEIANTLTIPKELKSGQIYIKEGKLSTGFACDDNNLVVVTGEDLFAGEVKKRRKVSSHFKQGEKVVFADLKVGDYVVHRNHGIGQFIGVNTIKADGVVKDYIKIRYRNDDILYVPTNNLDSIRKYIGGGEDVPKINRLGSKEWENTKTKVKKNLQTVARELIELYAKRQKVKGFAFSPDTPWQKQFEDSFPYAETEDQLRCIEEVKKDMETPKPMDRLLCGDVGYGKTEVAIRAAFKAVMDQKQVAYLVPTTVLANQQYESFKNRMEDFAIRVELLNRFRTKKEQEEVIRKLKLGEVDVVIGTHRLLSKDVAFKDLGLLIIDEEHRFGVKDKEKIKQYKENIDVLTMTATPIPRTLHMSIVGVRDMSVIYEPPQNRKPVQTYVMEYDEEIVREGITKELERDGQVFYLFNNVEHIEKKAYDIEHLVPEAKVAFAHGKMSGKELEDIMMDFINGNVNVLVCTTILESGIDIPNANTIIVENADRLGLAQLYQIRGRVGRAEKQAYSYIMYKRDKMLSEVADKRLKAIKEFTEFGSGFKIAMRDLEIRGAGSLLRRSATWTYGTSRI